MTACTAESVDTDVIDDAQTGGDELIEVFEEADPQVSAAFADDADAPSIGFPSDDGDEDEADEQQEDPSGAPGCLDNAGDPLPGITFTVAHQVIDGELAEPCFGSEDETLLDAWRILVQIAPPDQLNDLAIFAGFEALADTNEASTLAYVVPVDDDGTQFQMAVNLPTSRNDWDETSLTIAHEFSHVFTAVPGELDRFASADDCATYDNNEGCYTDDSIMAGWYERFWPSYNYDPTGGPAADEVDGEARCDNDPGFFGAYGASNPEEDFAESFAAYVMRVEAFSDEQQARLDWIDQFPGLREFRDRAEQAGYGPLANNFGECGFG